VEASSSLRTLLIVVVVAAFDRYIRSTAIFVAHDAYDGYIRSIRLLAVSVSTSSFDSRLFLYHHLLIIILPILIADSARSIRFVAALYNDGYIHTTAITVIGEYRPPSIRVFFSVSSLTYRYHSIVIADSLRGSIRFVAALYNDGYIRTTAITVIGEYRPPSIRVYFRIVVV